MLLPASAAAQQQAQQCDATEVVEKVLSEKYHESRTAQAITAAGALLEVWSGDAGTYSITLTSPDGVTCLVGSGDGWRLLKQATKGQPL